MQYAYLNKKDENQELIVFFNGWAMNETAISHLSNKNYDIVMLNDYRNLDFDFSVLNLEKYTKKYLVAWSMGVFVANNFADILNKFDYKVAVNGTNQLISDEYGIPVRVYKLTARCLNESSFDKFIKNMFKGSEINKNIKITRPLDELKEELIEIQKMKFEKEIKFDKAYISDDDKIIPTKNQIAFYQNKIPVSILNATHYPFQNFNSWQDLIC